MWYKDPMMIDSCIWNNRFAYTERINQYGRAEITIPILSSGGLSDVEIWKHIVFSEIDEKNTIYMYTWLEKLVCIDNSIYVIDNHNHALYCRYDAFQKWLFSRWIPCIHVDQHSDLSVPDTFIDVSKESDLSYIAEYVNQECDVGSFIVPAQKSGLIGECIQIRTESWLLDFSDLPAEYILDIDLDFWVPEMWIIQFEATIEKIKNLIISARVVTIATSPYFMDQSRALEVLRMILDA